MSFQPQVTSTGLSGWRVLQRTQSLQQASFDKSPDLTRDVDYFMDKIGDVKTAQDLVSDRRLLKVALGAFGLDADIDKKAFVRKLLEQGTTNKTALANRLTEPSYKKFAAAFGFGESTDPKTGTAGFGTKITEAYKTRQFEAAIGQSDQNMRLALSFKREIADLAAGEKGGSWYSIIGSKSLSEVMNAAFGLPSSFAKLDVDQQRDILRDKSKDLLGSADLSVFQDPAKVSKVIDRFLAKKQIDGDGSSNGKLSSVSLLQNNSGSNGSNGLLNLLLSQG